MLSNLTVNFVNIYDQNTCYLTNLSYPYASYIRFEHILSSSSDSEPGSA